MGYQVLARKWRPHCFQEMVGQEHVLRMLGNALDSQRLHHAYLFTGTRGVGKTTLARILAKCLNCEKGISANPCNECSACHSIDTGRFLDLIEVDAASRTKVEDTRELLDNVQYAPSQGRYKIYLIDEVHMLSGHSFNALLKTLEEPPLHVKFLLATTDPKRLPITVLSRCLQFHLKSVPVEKITQQLEHICQQENICFETSALTLLAQSADGSMRDALSLLDQTISYSRDHITLNDTRQMLGYLPQEAIFCLLQALLEQNGVALLTEISRLAEQSADFTEVLNDLISLLHQISITQIVPDFSLQNEKIKRFVTDFSAQEVQLYYQIALIGRRDLAISPNIQQGFEMVMLRMLAFRPMTEGQGPTPTPIKASEQLSLSSHSTVISHTIEKFESKQETLMDWGNILPKLGLTGLAFELASHCTLEKIKDQQIHLLLSKKHESILNKTLCERIEQSLHRYFGQSIKLTMTVATTDTETPAKQQQQEKTTRHLNATEALKNDKEVKKMMDMFGATIDLSSIQTIDS